MICPKVLLQTYFPLKCQTLLCGNIRFNSRIRKIVKWLSWQFISPSPFSTTHPDTFISLLATWSWITNTWYDDLVCFIGKILFCIHISKSHFQNSYGKLFFLLISLLNFYLKGKYRLAYPNRLRSVVIIRILYIVDSSSKCAEYFLSACCCCLFFIYGAMLTYYFFKKLIKATYFLILYLFFLIR